MLNWLKRQIAGKELAELNRYRLASAEAFRWNVGHVPAAAETADWIIRVAEGVTPLSPEKLRDRLMRPNTQANQSRKAASG